ncbi:hypothetical protein BC937DRAFT_88188 [Endogone sp. FLAS-F59071]|nr:hypothetical protein BC937DRAFT_88188 [Endogone sp. FLAS-F59071]|eukprot:RUS22641.1 hypothetical protein BC937DRAFT_88188 [Endogone sp. FLAS-F59071]
MPRTSSSPLALTHPERVLSALPIQSAAPILSVPPEILLEICRVSILGNLDIWACSLVCQAWRAVFLPMAWLPMHLSNVEIVDLHHIDYDGWEFGLEYTKRLAVLLAESARLGLDDCAHVRSILINVCDLFDRVGSYHYLPDMEQLLLSVFAAGLPNLHSLDFEYSVLPPTHSDDLSHLSCLYTFFTRLFPYCSSVEELIVSDNSAYAHYTPATTPCSPRYYLNPLIRGLAPTLRMLILSRVRADPGLEDALSACLSLEDVTFEGVRNADVRRCLSVWPRLRCLGLQFAEPAEDALLERVGEMYPGLTELYLHGYKRRPGGGAGIAALMARCRGIRELILTDMEDVDDTALQVIVDKCTELESLHLTRLKRLTGAAVRLESLRWKKLERMRLDGCVAIVSAFVGIVVTGCPNLEVLYLPEHLGQNDDLSETLERMNYERVKRSSLPYCWTKESRAEKEQKQEQSRSKSGVIKCTPDTD